MKQPNIVIRFAGTPLIACLLIAGLGFVAYSGYTGQVAWWVALAAALLVFRTLSAVGTLRRYETWRAKWDSMTDTGQRPAITQNRRRWKLATVMVLLFVLVLVAWGIPEVKQSPLLFKVLPWVWAIAAIYLLVRLLRSVLRGGWNTLRRSNRVRSERAMEAPVELALGRASNCPTRASAQKNLPDYCLRLIGGN